jgi:hypothetical protein
VGLTDAHVHDARSSGQGARRRAFETISGKTCLAGALEGAGGIGAVGVGIAARRALCAFVNIRAARAVTLVARVASASEATGRVFTRGIVAAIVCA